jgi:hypothetical protein
MRAGEGSCGFVRKDSNSCGVSEAAAITLLCDSIPDLRGAYSRRINIQHRLVYQVLEEERVVKVLRLGTHFE